MQTSKSYVKDSGDLKRKRREFSLYPVMAFLLEQMW